MKPPSRSLVIAIVGGSGAGKSWLAERLCRSLGEPACRLTLDDFYRDRSHLPLARRARLNFDVPEAIDWPDAQRVLRDCRAGLPTRVPRYDFSTYSRCAEPRSWLPRPVVFVEGLWLLHTAELRAWFDVKIFVDAPADLRQARRLARDTVERGYSPDAVRDRLVASVMPMHQRYVEPQKRWADVVLAQPFRPDDVGQLTETLWPPLVDHGVLPCWRQETFRAELASLLLDHEYCN